VTAGTPRAGSPQPRRRAAGLLPYLLLAPGVIWLLLFYVLPAIQMFLISVSTGSLADGYTLAFTGENYALSFERFGRQFGNSLLYGGAATLLTLLIGFPLAYTIAFRGGRYKNVLLLLVIAPFFTSFLIRTISWQVLLGDEGPVLGALKDVGLLPFAFGLLGTPVAVVAGITYNFLPFMILPLYVALEKIDPVLIEAASDLYSSRWAAFRRVTLPLAMPGVFAGTMLTFIPAMGDFVNAQLLGTPQTQMIGNVIQNRFLQQNDYPVAAALSFILMAGILVAVIVYTRLLGSEQLTGG